MIEGRIEVVVGPMFAGKTTELLRRINRAKLGRKRCVIMKYYKDVRYSEDEVSTHDLETHIAIPCEILMPHLHECLSYDVIGVDEGQFYPDIVEFAENLANCGRTVIVAALDGTFQRKPFGRVLELMAKSESITKLTAICRNFGKDASFTKRTVESSEIELIGGGDKYIAVSRSAFFNILTSGEIHLTIGPVKSGKTTELLRCLNRHLIANRKVICISPNSIDNYKTSVPILTTSKLPEINEMDQYHIIGIDEGQFYQGLAEWADTLANNNKIIIVSAKDGNQYHEAYPVILELFPRCENVRKLDSICPITGRAASFSTAINENQLVPISRFAIINSLSIGIAMNLSK